MKRVLLFLLLAPLAHAANGFVQIASCNQQAGATSCTITFGSNQTAGNSVVVIRQTAAGNGGDLAFGVVPTLAGTTCFTLRQFDVDITQGANGAYESSHICPNIPGGTTTGPTVISAPVGQNPSFTAFAIEFSGLGTWPSFDQAPSTWPVSGSGGAFQSGTTSSMSASSTSTAGALLIAYGGQQTTGAATTCTAGAGYTIPSGGQVAGSATSLACVEYNLSSAGGATTATMTTNAAHANSFVLISLRNGSVPYSGSGTGPSNGFFLQRGTVNAIASHNAAGSTEAFASLVVAPNGNILMSYEQASPGQGSGPNAAAALRISTNGGSTWSDYSGATNGGSDCANWSTGVVFCGDRANADSNWFPGYNGLAVNGSTTYYQVTVMDNLENCVHSYLYLSTNSGGSWGSAISIDSTASCWMANLIFVPGPTSNSNCLNGCIIAPIEEQISGPKKFFFSTDGGNTWPNSVTIPTGPDSLFNQDEAFMVYGGGTILSGIARSAGQPFRSFQTTDFGTTWTAAYTNLVPNIANLNVNWTLPSPVIFNPNLGDGNITLLYGDRSQGSIRITNAPLSTFLNSPQTLPQGETLTTFTGTNTSGYPAVCNVSGNTWLFAWYQPNGSNNGQIFTMQGTFVPNTFAPFAMHR